MPKLLANSSSSAAGCLLFDLRDLHVEGCGLARQLLVGVFGGEGRVELARIAGLGADQRVLEFLHDLARADGDGHVLAAAAFELRAVDRAGEVDGDAVVRGGDARDFIERRPLLAQRVEHGFEILVANARHRLLDGEIRDGLQLHFRQNFEHGGVFEVRARAHGDRLDARSAGGIELLARHRLGERGAHEVVDDLAMHLFAVLLADHRERRLAGTKTLEPRGARNLVEPLRYFAVDLRRGDRHFEPAFQSARGGQRNLHVTSSSSFLITGACGRVVRKERLELSRVAPLEPKSSASTSSATFARPRCPPVDGPATREGRGL